MPEAAAAPAADWLAQLTEPRARDALRLAGFSGGRGSTGPEDGAFSMTWRKDTGERADVEMHIFDTDFKRQHNRPLVTPGIVEVEHGAWLLTVSVTRNEEGDEAASQAVLDELQRRASSGEEPIALVALPPDTWLRPHTAAVDSRLVIAPSLIETATAALEAQGYQEVSRRTEQQVDLTNPSDSGFPGYELAGQTDSGAQGRINFRCVREDTDPQFWPEAYEAELGEAIGLAERCKVVVSVRPDSADADLAASTALFEALIAFQPQ